MAVGPNHVFEVVNSQGRIWTKTGTQVDDFSLMSFFITSGLGAPVDPKIMFDAISDRWFVSAFVREIDSVVLASSTTNDPTGTFNVYHIPYPSTICPDQPKMGISNDKFVISTNDFTNRCNSPTTFVGGHLKVLDKSRLIEGASVPFQNFPADITRFAITPAQSLSSTNTLYMVEVEFSDVTFYTIEGTVPSAVLASQTLPILTAPIPPDGRQAGTTDLINTGSNRIQDAKWRQEKLWFSLNDGCFPPGDSTLRSCIHLTQIDTTVPTVTQDFRVSLGGFDFFYPAIAIDESEGLGVIFGYSTPLSFPSLAITSQPAYLDANTVGVISSVVIGTEPNEDGRYGDYFAAAVDPSDPTILWAAGQYHILEGPLFGLFPSEWSTWITSFTINAIPIADPGSFQIVDERTEVTLDGSNSSDPNSDSLTYSWTQTLGPSVTLNNPTSVSPTFTAPSVETDTVITFTLTVNDGIVDSNNSNSVSITVQNIDCFLPILPDWIITTSCTLETSFSPQGNVLIKNNSVLTIGPSASLGIDFTNQFLLIKSGSGVLIKAGGNIGGEPPPPPPLTASVSVPAGTSVPGCEETNECFIPFEVTVGVGGEVTWSNDDTAAHTVTSGTAGDGPSGEFDSSLFFAGTTFSHTFESAGEFPYFCLVHPWMNGIVTVLTLPPGVNSLSLEKSFYTNEESMVFVGVEGTGTRSVFVTIRDSSENFVALVSDPASDNDGSFSTIPRIVENIFTTIGMYTATAFTDMETENDGLTIQLGYDGNRVFEASTFASVSVPQGTSVPGCEETNECFIPFEVTVGVGGEVTWSNDDTAAHTVTSGSAVDVSSGEFDSSLFFAGTTFSHTFEAAGEFPYFCQVHPWMTGIVNVE